MARVPIRLNKPILNFETRQVTVFNEVLELFSIKCCEAHQPVRENTVERAKHALQALQRAWTEGEADENRELLAYAQAKGFRIEDVVGLKTNLNYHKCALTLADWTKTLSTIQARFQSYHVEELPTMRMPPGMHEVSDYNLKVNYRLAILAYVTLSNHYNRRIPLLTPYHIFFMAQVLVHVRTLENPCQYHILSLFIEQCVHDANNYILERV